MEKRFRFKKGNCDSEAVISLLNGALETKMGQYEMLWKTLKELQDKEHNGYNCAISIDMINKELESTKAEIAHIREQIATEEKKACDFYDSVVKHSKAAEYVYAEGKKENPNEYSLYDSFKKQAEEVKEKAESKKWADNKYLSEINDNLDNMAKSNRFLVHIEDALGIPTTMVKSVCYNDEKKELAITVYDFVKNVYGKKYPLMRMLNDPKRRVFTFSIDHLDAKDKVQYTEIYEHCKIKEVQRGILDYSFSEISTVEILISYDNVIYEAD